MKEGWCGDEDTGTCDESNQRIGISRELLPVESNVFVQLIVRLPSSLLNLWTSST